MIKCTARPYDMELILIHICHRFTLETTILPRSKHVFFLIKLIPYLTNQASHKCVSYFKKTAYTHIGSAYQEIRVIPIGTSVTTEIN